MTADRAVRTVDPMLAAPDAPPPPTPLPPPLGPSRPVAVAPLRWLRPRRRGRHRHLDRADAVLVVPFLFVLVVPFEKLFPRHRQRAAPARARHRRRLRRQPSRCWRPSGSSSASSSGCSAWPGCPAWPCARSSTRCRRSPASSLGVVLFDVAIYWVHRWSHEVPFLWRFHSHPPLDRAPRLDQRVPQPPDRRRAARPAVRLPARRRVLAPSSPARSPSSRSSPGCSCTPTCAGAGGRCSGSSSRPSSTTGTTPTSPTPTTPTTRCSSRCGTSCSAPTSCPATAARRATASRRRAGRHRRPAPPPAARPAGPALDRPPPAARGPPIGRRACAGASARSPVDDPPPTRPA